MHNRLARLLAKCVLKLVAVVLPEVVARNRLAAVLVYSLEDLVAQPALAIPLFFFDIWTSR